MRCRCTSSRAPSIRRWCRAYGWPDIAPEHGFHELDFLPENDRTRFTISDKARRVALERLLELNFKRHAEEEEKKG